MTTPESNEAEDGEYCALTRAIGPDEAKAMLASVDVMLHGLSIGDWRRVYKGLLSIHETLRRISGSDLPDYLGGKP